MDSSILTMYTDNISWLESTGDDGTSFCQVADSSMDYNDTILLGDMFHSLRLESDHYVEEATNRVIRLGDMLSHLKEMAHLFCMKWISPPVRYGKGISCNRIKRYGYSDNPSRIKILSITIGCDWVVDLI